MTRRDRCHTLGILAATLTPEQAVVAWEILARRIEKLGDRDIPKWKDLMAIIKCATVVAKQPKRYEHTG